MPIRTHRRRLAAGLTTTLATVLVACPLAAHAAERTKTETLRIFDQPVSFTYTAADGTVSHEPPAGPPQAGDVLEIDSRMFAGNHRKHAKRATMSGHLECTFGTGPEPDCFSWAAIGGSLLRFHGDELIGGTGRYQGATGRILSNRERPGGNDIVARIQLP
jgi:hypothetical protein